MEVTKIHRVLSFQQYDFIRPYIEMNAKFRQEANNDFEKDFYKLMNNAMFGKTMENLRKRVKIDLVTTEERLVKIAACPSYQDFKAFDENLIAMKRTKTKLLLNRPMYIGFCVLDISKAIMYDFYYNILYAKFDRKMKLLFTDTDSLCIQVQTPSLAEFLDGLEEKFDTSNFPKEHSKYSDVNKKVPGKMKFETGADPIQEFVGLRSKMYSILLADKKEMKRAKGVSRCVTENELSHNDFYRCYYDDELKQNKMTTIRSDHHRLYAQEVNKVTLCPYDDKRSILGNGTQSVPYGYCGPYPLDLDDY